MANNPPNDNDLLSGLDSSDQHMRDRRLMMEYRFLMKHAPGGVYILPELDEIRKFHGVIFVRKGLYRDGVFRFRIDLPSAYNSWNTYPLVTFTPPIFNPLIDMSTGKLELKVDEAFKEWNPDKHFLQSALTFLKKAFYTKSYDEYPTVPNEEARKLFNEDKDEFLQRVQDAVLESHQRLYDPQSSNSTLIFTEPKPAHANIIRDILLSPSQPSHENKEMNSSDLNASQATQHKALIQQLREEVEADATLQRLQIKENVLNDDSIDLSLDSINIK